MAESKLHTFHIPVLGVGFSIDTPLKVARYGISSVISLVDDGVMEDLRKFYTEKHNKPFQPIPAKEEDSRARRITAYLNMINKMVREQFDTLKNSAFEIGGELHKYFEMLPDVSQLKHRYRDMLSARDRGVIRKLQDWLRDNMRPGSIDVNIMTKVDNPRRDANGEILPPEHNAAHASLRGYAKSDLESSIIFSAGMNPRLYSYLSSFPDFLPQPDGSFRKKVVIKVSDFRSALIQGKFLAKKGVWVSEYRIESGLNCGGHAFPTDGYLLGPIMDEFTNRRDELLSATRETYLEAMSKNTSAFNSNHLELDITVQGGVGLASEHDFLLRRYNVRSVGWGSPFMLVPEATNVDKETLQQLCDAGEDDIYLSHVSPLGVPFSNLRNNSKDVEKMTRAENGRPGSPCTKKYLEFNTELSDKPICTASMAFLSRKIQEIKDKFRDPVEYQQAYNNAVEKVCLCEGLVAPALKVNNIIRPKESMASAVCPGPNLAYFSKIVSLKEIVDHIYGRINLVTDSRRPNMFIKELSLYIDYLRDKIDHSLEPLSEQAAAYIETFKTNLNEGLAYYKNLIPEIEEETENIRIKIREDLERLEERLLALTPAFDLCPA
jgi:hypothetical protein